MPLHIYVFLLVVCLLLPLLWHLDWFRLQSFSPQAGVKLGTLHRLLKPRTPDDCPCAGYLTHPFKHQQGQSRVEHLARDAERGK